LILRATGASGATFTFFTKGAIPLRPAHGESGSELHIRTPQVPGIAHTTLGLQYGTSTARGVQYSSPTQLTPA